MENKMLLKQINGLYCLYSCITKSLIQINITRKSFINWCVLNGSTIEYAESILDRAYSFVDIIKMTAKYTTMNKNRVPSYEMSFSN